MRRHKAFPRPGDRIRLAVPLPSDASAPHARYGTVLERSCGRSNALRVRWDRDDVKTQYAVDAGLETWLADAAWYWDKAQLEVVDGRREERLPVAALSPAPVTEEDAWLTTSPRAGVHAGVDGSLDAVAEWEAALASEIEGAAGGSWEHLLANALGSGSPVAATKRPSASQQRQAPAPPAAERPAATPRQPAPAAGHKDIRKSTRVVRDEVEPEPEPVITPVKPWTGDDIIPRRGGGGKRWGRR